MSPKNKLIFSIFIFILLLFLSVNVKALANPAAVYCKELGYEYKVVENVHGQEGICSFPDSGNEKCDEWDFFKGKCGKEHSYCALKGYELKTENGESVCVFEEDSEIKEIPAKKLMKLEEKMGKENKRPQTRVLNPDNLDIGIKTLHYYNFSDYSYWNWTNPPNGTNYSRGNFTFFDNVQGWITPIRNQGDCGSCWAFSSIASVESKYELNNNDSRLNPDLSEQHEVSCDDSCYLGECQDGCAGGWMDVSMKFFMDFGLVDEYCFPYNESEPPCSNRCSDYTNRIWTITDYTTTYEGAQTVLELSNEETEQWLIDYGPLSAGVGIDSECGGNFDGDIYRCTNDACLNHGVLLVGYNDTGNDSTSYWIIKNSWGTGFGDGGYYKLGFNECNFTSEFEYPHVVNAPNFKPKIILNNPANNSELSNVNVVLNFTVLNRKSLNATCDLIINDSLNQTNSSVLNNTATIFNVSLSVENYFWYVRCWEKDFGIVNTSETRSFSIKPIVVNLVSPINNTSENDAQVNFTCNASSSSELKNITFFLWNSSLVYNKTESITGNFNQSVFNYTFSSEGDYSWYCEGFDNLSNSDYSLNYTFKYDTTKPSLEIVSPINNSWYNGLKFNVSSNEALDLCWFKLNSLNNSMAELNDTYFYYNEDYDEGSYNVTFFCNDSAGNLNYSSIYFFHIEKTNPLILLISPINNYETTITSIDFDFEVSDGLNISSCELILTGEDDSVTGNQSIIINDSESTITKTLSRGDYNWRINCTDQAGNEGTNGTRAFTIAGISGSGGGGGGTDDIIQVNQTNQSNNTNTTYHDYPGKKDSSQPKIVCADGYKLLGEKCVKMSLAETLGISLWGWIAVMAVIACLALYIIMMRVRPRKHRY